jgi:hypothetical protein
MAFRPRIRDALDTYCTVVAGYPAYHFKTLNEAFSCHFTKFPKHLLRDGFGTRPSKKFYTRIKEKTWTRPDSDPQHCSVPEVHRCHARPWPTLMYG